MKKKALSLLLILTLAIGLLAGCGQKQTTNNNGKVTENQVSYAYDQKENIIDDNYRNYYEIFVYSFYDSNGDGIGDLQGVIQKLDYIEYMGFNGIWLMPIMPSPSYHKYDVIDYCAIDPLYGTMEDFEQLIEECHNRGINLIIDFVMNHTSSEHEWFTTACDYLKTLGENEAPDLNACPYVGYYHFSKKQESEKYYEVPGTNWYYEGDFWSGMPDLNYESEGLKTDFEEIAKFWVDKGVDGFRVDAVKHIVPSNPESNYAIMNWIYNYCKQFNPDFYMVSEVFDSLFVFAEYYKSLTPSIFNFDAGQQTGALLKAAKDYMSSSDFVDKMISYDKRFSELNPDYIDALFITNHDMGRVAEYCVNNEKNMKMAAGLMMMMNGNPFVYYGEEIGMTSTSDKDENKRLPMIWSDTDNTGKTIGPDGIDTSITSSFEGLEQQLEDGHSILNYYRRAIELRNENPEIARGTITKIESLCTDTYAVITKTYEGSTIAIAYNTTSEEVTIPIGESELSEMAIRGYLTLNGEEITLKNGVLTMPAKSICILK